MRLLLILLFSILTFVVLFISTEQNVVLYFVNTKINLSLRIFAVLIVLFIFIIIFFSWIGFKISNIPANFFRNQRFKSEKNDLINLLEGFEAKEGKNYIKLAKIFEFFNKNKQKSTFLQFQHMVNLLEMELVLNASNPEKFRPLEDILRDLTLDENTILIGLKKLVEIRIAKKCYHDALIYAEKAYAYNNKTQWVVMYLVDIYLKTNQFDQAEKMMQKAYSEKYITEEEKKNYLIGLLIIQGNFYQTNYDLSKAIKSYEKLLKIDPANLEALSFIIKKLIKNNELKQLTKIVKDAWIGKNNAEIASIIFSCSNLSFAYKETLFKELIKLDEEEKLASIVLAKLYLKDKKYDLAKSCLDKLLLLHEPDSQISKIMAIAELKIDPNNKNEILSWIERI